MDAAFTLEEALDGLKNGDFTRLTPLFEGKDPTILRWYEEKRFEREPVALAEAFSNACFIGQAQVVEYWLARGLNPSGGNATGLNAFHWAGNRGQLEIVKLLLQAGAPLETKNMYGGTVLGSTLHGALHEKLREGHLEIIQLLVNAGARVNEVQYPTGHTAIDAILKTALKS